MPRSKAANQQLRDVQRAKILDAARLIFSRKGPTATMDDIAALLSGYPLLTGLQIIAV